MKIITVSIVILLAAAFAINAVSAASYTSVTYQQPSISYSTSDYNTYWPVLDQQTCRGRQDIILSVPPAGCQPVVVRSDLLAQQNVPVFCQVSALQINPLIDIKSIDSLSFSGSQYPSEVVGTGFHPAQIAIGSSYGKLTGNPSLSNIGYVVVILKRQTNETALPDSVNLNLTARLTYNAGNAFGIGQASFTLPVLDDKSWSSNMTARSLQSFWQGKYFVRAESASPADAIISIYYGDQKISTVHVQKGQTSSDLFIPGFSSCDATLQVAYDGFQASMDHARLEVSDTRGTDTFDGYSSGSSLFGGGSTRFYNDQCSVQRLDIQPDGSHGSVDVVCGFQRFTLTLTPRQTTTSSGLNISLNASKMVSLDSTSYQYYQNALASYTDVATKYPAEPNSQQPYGLEALTRAIELARNSNDVKAEDTLINLMLQNYPSNNPSQYKGMLSQLETTDFSAATANVQINNRAVTVRLLGFVKASADASVDLKINNQPLNFQTLNSTINLNGLGTAKISSINADQVTLYATCNARQGSSQTAQSTTTVSEGSTTTLCGTPIYVNRINVDKLVSVRILPNVHNTETDTNLSVTIGIEKRSIQLSPSKTKEMITNLNATIKKWESISSTLGKVVSGMKAACFATAAVLTAKNFIGGIDGTSMARQRVMQGDNGWTAKCQSAFKSGKVVAGLSGDQPYASVDDCLRQNSDAINNDVSAAANVLKNVNAQLTQNDKAATQSNSLLGSTVDTDKSAASTIGNIQTAFKNDQTTVSVNGKQETLGNFVSKTLSADAYKNNVISYNDLRDFDYYATLLKTPGISQTQKDAANSALSSIMARAENNQQQFGTRNAAQAATSSFYSSPIDSYSSNPNAAKGNYYGDTYNLNSVVDSQGSDLNSYGAGKPFKEIVYNQQLYGIILVNRGGAYSIDGSHVYRIDTSTNPPTASPASAPEIEGISKLASSFQKVDATSYTNKYNNPEVRYWETDPYKGMPALVPVDTTKGWYAATEQTLPVFGQQSAFESSGKISSFWLCNVGKNGDAEFDKSNKGDDTCQQFNLNTGQATTFFPGLSQTETNSLVQKAISALSDAARQHVDGIKSITLGSQATKVGQPAVNVPSAQCQDYMSPEECQLLFNVCDPVICPASRCNLGGQYPVSNVPQTGIIGSTLLCLPNAREGVYIPVCLTGIQSGIDGFVSLLKNHRDCLQESLDTGQLVGICDQIYSVYACEFFWNQVAPVAKLLLPKLVEAAYGQSTHGGGEYLTVMAAWQNTQQAINYFTQQYAVNSLQAFQSRSLDQFGESFCKAFGSISAPKVFSNLVQPDSPSQFNAWFSSTPYSDVTVPATAQYKVFYHIYAGKDTGAYYEVYLKNPPQTSYYATAQTVLVASGFAARGEYASETKDFTAPIGYQELCVRINQQEQCGFKQVSTSFAANYVADSLTANQLTQQDITSETGCVSGDPSLGSVVGSLATGNVQGAAQSAISPQVYNQGIIRICSTDDPGKASAPGRFIDVGYCGDQKIRCWLDSNSVNQAISNMSVGIKQATITELQQTATNALGAQQFITDAATANSKLDVIDSALQQVDTSDSQTLKGIINQTAPIIQTVQTIQSQLVLSSTQARASYLLGRANDIVATFAINQYKKVALSAAAQQQAAQQGQIADLKLKLSQLQALQTALSSPNVQGLTTDSFPNLVYVTQALQLGVITQDKYNDMVGKFSLLSPSTWFVNNIQDLIPYVNKAITDTQNQISQQPKALVEQTPAATQGQQQTISKVDSSYTPSLASLHLSTNYFAVNRDTSSIYILYDYNSTTYQSGLYFLKEQVHYKDPSYATAVDNIIGSVTTDSVVKITDKFNSGLTNQPGFENAVIESKIISLINNKNINTIGEATSTQTQSAASAAASAQLHTMPVIAQTQAKIGYSTQSESISSFAGQTISLYYNNGSGAYDLHIALVPGTSGGSIYVLDQSGKYTKFGAYDSSGIVSIDSSKTDLVTGYTTSSKVSSEIKDRFQHLQDINGKSLKAILPEYSTLF